MSHNANNLNRRRFLKALPITVGAVWSKPIIYAVTLPAHAQSLSDTAPLAETARYRVTFATRWTQADNGGSSFPTGRNPHFSRLIGAVHNNRYIMWRPDEIASNGIEQMAEVGATGPLNTEIQAQITAGNAKEVILGTTNSNFGSQQVDFEVNRQFSLVSLVSMLAPSSDWFVGVRDVSLLNADGSWKKRSAHDLVVYDSGTDRTDNFIFRSAGTDITPHQPIKRLQGSAEFGFTEGMEVVGMMTFEML